MDLGDNWEKKALIALVVIIGIIAIYAYYPKERTPDLNPQEPITLSPAVVPVPVDNAGSHNSTVSNNTTSGNSTISNNTTPSNEQNVNDGLKPGIISQSSYTSPPPSMRNV